MKIENAADFARAFSVSHETLERLELYERLLLQWQKAVNLVSPTTLPQVWRRHFAEFRAAYRLGAKRENLG